MNRLAALCFVACSGNASSTQPTGSAQPLGDASATASAVRDELARWEPLWEARRQCFVGPTQLAADVRDAMALQKLTERGCRWRDDVPTLTSPAMRELARAMTRLDAITGKNADSSRSDEVPYAVRDVDDAHGALRVQAQLPPLVRSTVQIPTPIPLAHAPIPFDEGNEPDIAIADHVLALDTRAIRVIAFGPSAILHGPGATWPAHDGSWGAAVRDELLLAGSLAGNVLAPTAATVAKQRSTIVAVLGRGAQRAIVTLAGTQQRVHVHRSSDEGRTWTMTDVGTAKPVSMTRELVDVIATDGSRWIRITVAGEQVEPLKSGLKGDDLEGCGTAATRWLTDGTTLWNLVRKTAIDLDWRDAKLVACGGDAVLVHGRELQICRANGCARAASTSHDHVGDLSSAGVAYARQQDRVVAVWKAGVPTPKFVRLAEQSELHALVSWDDVPHVVVYRDGALHIERVP